MLTLLLSLSLSHAAPAGHYHPNEIAASSQLFGRAADVAGTIYQDREEQAQALAASLRAFEEALDLLGDRAPADQRARYAELEQLYHREHAVLSRFATEQADAFDAAFSGAMERALTGHDAQECQDAMPSGLRTAPRFGGRAQAEPCIGPSLNAEIAAEMDDDPVLQAELESMFQATWPEWSLTAEPVAAVGPADATATLSVRAWMRRGAAKALRAIIEADEIARLDFQAAIESGASKEELTALTADAEAVTALTAKRRAEVAYTVLATTDATAAKLTKKGGATLAWCAQPALLGGCSTPALADEVATALFEHPKVKKAFGRADAIRPPQD